ADGAVVSADAFAAAVPGEFGGDRERAGLQMFHGLPVALDQLEDLGVAAGEVVQDAAAVAAPGGEGDADAGGLGGHVEVGLAAHGEVGGLGGAVGGGRHGASVPVTGSQCVGTVADGRVQVRICGRVYARCDVDRPSDRCTRGS